MIGDLTFKQACEVLRADDNDPKLLTAIDNLLGVALIVTPMLAGFPPGTLEAGLGLLGVKGELARNARYLLNKIGKKKETSAKHQQRMEAAHAIIVYASFFEAVDEAIPGIWKTLGIKVEDKQGLVAAAKSALSSRDSSAASEQEKLQSRVELPAPFPHPADSFAVHLGHTQALYRALAKGLVGFLSCLRIVEPKADNAARVLADVMDSLPKRAVDMYEAQYFDLAAKFEEFFVWASLQEHTKTRALLNRMPKYIKAQVKAANASKKSIDVGFQGLSKAIASIPRQIDARKVHVVLEELGNYYADAINRPIITDEHADGEEERRLTYPNVRDIFIPQSFKTMRYSGVERLEREETWDAVDSRNDLGLFLLAYFSSPISTRLPLVLLGHPGSGKSLLTQMLAATLNSDRLYTAMRVRLRDVNADQGIASQIREQIFKDIGRETNWAEITDHMPQPALLLFDGYDELLQASGRVFAGYISQVQDFQNDEIATRKKPVRAVVTSRITLIDKAEIRPGTTILRLEDFDAPKRSEWISLWNQANQQYFSQRKVDPFALPKDDANILPLASQPLLLLMLALYDSEENALRKRKKLDRTALYDGLLRQFVEREKKKDKSRWSVLAREDKLSEIDREMERLGAAAIGMFNRRTLHIRVPELNRDLEFFELERDAPEGRGSRLSQAELLFGSFFFVHRSKTSSTKPEAPDSTPQDVAFEFLHTTFGEFLTADFLLRRLREEVETISELKQGQRSRKELDKKFSEASGLSDAWFAGLVHAALHSRPVVLEMIREWLPHTLNKAGPRTDGFLDNLDLIVNNQLKRILTSKAFPPLITDRTKSPFGELPLLGHAAIYSLNLVILRTVVSPSGFSFEEGSFQPSPDGCRAWDRLTHLWRAWFSIESLAGVGAILSAERERGIVRLEAKQYFKSEPSYDTLEVVLNVGLALADELTVGLAGFLAYERGTAGITIESVGRYLYQNDINVEFQIVARELRELRLGLNSREGRGADSREGGSRLAQLRYILGRHPSFAYRRGISTSAWEWRELLIAATKAADIGFVEELLNFNDYWTGRGDERYQLEWQFFLEVLLTLLGEMGPHLRRRASGSSTGRIAECLYMMTRRFPPRRIPPAVLRLIEFIGAEIHPDLAAAIHAGLKAHSGQDDRRRLQLPRASD